MKTSNDIEMTSCDCCHEEYHERSEGVTLRTPNSEESLRLCESCADDAHEDLDVNSEDLLTGEVPEPVFKRLLEWTHETAVAKWADPKKRIETVDDITLFFDDLTALLVWHPDSAFSEYVNRQTDERTFDDSEAKQLDRRMRECFKVADKAKNLDVYDLGLASLALAGRAPKDPAELPTRGQPVTEEELKEEATNAIIQLKTERYVLFMAMSEIITLCENNVEQVDGQAVLRIGNEAIRQAGNIAGETPNDEVSHE